MKKRIAIALALLLVLFLGMTDASAADGWIWRNSDTATLYNTLAEAVAASQKGDIIRVKGDFDYASMQASIPDGCTLVVAGDTKVTGAAGQNGITLKSGAALRCENGAGLTMTAFGGVALTVQKGAQINDGRYTFKDNAGKNGTRGISIGGAVKGSGDRNSVVLDVDDKCAWNTYESIATFENCTVSINSQTPTWQDARNLTLNNASFTVAGFGPASFFSGRGQGFYINQLTMDHSELTINAGSAMVKTGTSIQGAISKVDHSIININTGFAAAFSAGNNSRLELTGSTMNLNNDGSGGLNLNDGFATFDASTLRSNGKQKAVMGLRKTYGTSHALFINGSNLETPATAVGHNGGSQIKNGYVVLGGSHHIFYAGRDEIYTGLGLVDTIPVNGKENGNERLDHFQLADPSINEIQAVNQNGQVYSYAVPNASDDGQKYVWVPGNAVTFKLNNTQAQFADHTTEDKSIQAMRGYALQDAVVANGQKVEWPQEPVAPGFRFTGWFTKEGTPFSAEQKVTKDTEVLARWENDAANYALVYHNGAEPDVEFLDVAGAPDRKIKVLGYEQVVQNKPDFARPGMEFLGWADQNGTAYAEGSEMVVPAGQDTVHLYAQWKDLRVSVRFSANGGTFGASSIFKTKTDVFTITQEAGGEVATVKAKAVSGVKLMDLLKSLDPKLESYTDGLKLSKDNKDSVAQRSGYEMRPSSFNYWGDPQYSWFSDQAGMTAVGISGAVINGPTTYYLSWKLAGDDVTPVPPQDLPADMWGDAQSDSAKVRDVLLGDTFAITAGIQTQYIKSLMGDIEKQLTNGQEDELAKIGLKDLSSVFVAKLTVPDGMILPSGLTKENLSPKGFGQAFTVTDVQTNGNVLTVTMTFNNKDVDTYLKLKQRVFTTDDWMTIRVDGCRLTDKVKDQEIRTAVGTVQGNMSAIAYDLGGSAKKTGFDIVWNGKQTADGKDEGTKADDARITYSVRQIMPVQNTLPGDLLVDGDTEHTAVYEVMQGDTVSLTGALDVRPILGQMDAIEAVYPNTPQDEIAVDVKNCEFTAKITLPTGMSFPETLEPQAENNFGGSFSIKSTSVTGQTATVVMKLKDGIKTYTELRKAVEQAAGQEGWMRLTIPNVKIDSAAAPGALLTTIGTLTGEMQATATHGQKSKVFSFAWNATQWPDGKDAVANDGTTIQVTVMPTPVAKNTLPGDLLVDGDTEHTAVYEVVQGDTVSLTGALDVRPILGQMDAIEAVYPNTPQDEIAVDVKNCEFTAKITLPAGMSFPQAVEPQAENNFGGSFSIKSTNVTGQTATVVMKLKDGIKTYTELRKAVEQAAGAEGWMRLTIPNVKIDDAAAPGTMLTTTGTLTGEMQATATHGQKSNVFSFAWNATQWADGKDAVANDDTTIQVTVMPTPVAKNTLPGDLLVNGDTEHTAVYEVMQGDTVSLTGALDVRPILGQMDAIEAVYPNTPQNEIAVDVKNCEFTAAITLPAGMSFPATLEPQAENNFGGSFSIKSTSVTGQTATVVMKLKDGIKTYTELRKAVEQAAGTEGWMRLTIPNVKIDDTAAPGTMLTTVGTLTGEMQATATHGQKRRAFSFAWNATQWADGKDAVAKDDTTIQVTVMPAPVAKNTLPGDLLVNGDTEHTAVYEVKQGDTVSLTGALDVRPILGQMDAIEAVYPNTPQDKIAVDVKNCEFTAKITLPAGMSFPQAVNPKAENNFGGSFSIKSTNVTGQTATVVMKLKDGIKTYTELRKAVEQAAGAEGWMRLTIPNVKIDSAAAPGTLLTTVGTLTGEMQATATHSQKRRAFSFAWNATQWPDGKDAVAKDDTTIQVTVKVKPAPQPTDNPSDYDRIKVTFSGTKKAVNHRLKGGEYAFTIKDGSGKIRQTVSNDEQGRIVFSPRTFSRTGTFTYTIEEVPGNRARMVYDKTVYTAKVTTKAVGGALQAKVELERDGVPYDGEIVFVNRLRTPQTGDSALTMPMILVLAAVVMLMLAKVQKKKNAA